MNSWILGLGTNAFAVGYNVAILAGGQSSVPAWNGFAIALGLSLCVWSSVVLAKSITTPTID